MTRSTAEQVAKEFEAQFGDLRRHDQYRMACGRAADKIKANLVPRWQDEPDAEWCWVEGLDYPCRAYKRNAVWMVTNVANAPSPGRDWFDTLRCRRVCPIGERPQDGGA
jgi:hypothetical protein